MAAYDPDILQKFADDLYASAGRLQFKYGFYGFLILLAVLLPLALMFHADTAGLLMAATLSALGIVGGIEVGRARAFTLKLEAQRTLCQLEIEKNLRRIGQRSEAAIPTSR